jgi:hypothetical protein
MFPVGKQGQESKSSYWNPWSCLEDHWSRNGPGSRATHMEYGLNLASDLVNKHTVMPPVLMYLFLLLIGVGLSKILSLIGGGK